MTQFPEHESQPTEAEQHAQAEHTNEIILEALANGLTYAAAADLAHCSTKTIQRRLGDPNFTQELARRRTIRLDEITGRLARLTGDAITVLAETLAGDNPQLRLRAATTIMTWASRMRIESEHERRFAEVELRLKSIVRVEGEPWHSTYTEP